jgi:hypothetical protein
LTADQSFHNQISDFRYFINRLTIQFVSLESIPFELGQLVKPLISSRRLIEHLIARKVVGQDCHRQRSQEGGCEHHLVKPLIRRNC